MGAAIFHEKLLLNRICGSKLQQERKSGIFDEIGQNSHNDPFSTTFQVFSERRL